MLLRLVRERGYDAKKAKDVLEFIGNALRLNDIDIAVDVKEEWNMTTITQEEAAREVRIGWAMEKGRIAEKHEMARKMLARGMEPEVIADLSGLSLEEVDALGRR